MRFYISIVLLFATQTYAADCRAFLTKNTNQPVFYNKPQVTLVPQDKPLNMLVWNTQKYPSQQTVNDLTRESEHSDFILLQEAIFSEEKETVFQRLARHFWMGVISFWPRQNKVATGVQTGTVYNTKTWQGIRSRPLEPFTNTPKMILITTHKIAGSEQVLTVANIHGINFVLTRYFEEQLRQLEDAIKNVTGPLIIAGDFNTHLPARKRAFENFVIRNKLNYSRPVNQSRMMVLDHVVSRNLTPLSLFVLDRINSSDHFPLRFQFHLGGPELRVANTTPEAAVAQ